MILALLMTATVTMTPMLTQRAYADDGVAIDATNFPDENFRNYISEDIDKNNDNNLSTKEIEDTTTIAPGQRDIKDFTGIEYFNNLESFNCSWNPVTNLDLSKNTSLIRLSCRSSSLTSLDVSKNTALTYIDCVGNPLTSLDVSKNTALTYINCYNTPLTSLDLSNNTKLTDLICGRTSITSLDLSKNTALTYINCYDTPLTSLDLSNNTKLTKLLCSSTSLTSLDLSNNTSLKDLDCSNNNLTSLDLSNNTSLEALYCSNNKLTNLDLSNNTSLEFLDCSSNQLTSLDLNSNTFLQGEDDNEPALFNSQSRSISADYSDGKLVVDLANDFGLDITKVSDVVVTGGTYSDGKATFDIPLAADAKITYNYDTNNTNLSTKMDVTLSLSMCMVTFDTNGGSSVGLQAVKTGDKVTKPADPTKSGYTFSGWYTDEACTTAYDFSSPVTEDMTLYAKWESTETTTDPTEPGTDDPIAPPSDDGDTTVTPEHPTSTDRVTKKPILNLKALTAGSRTEKLVWTKVKGAEGYDIYYAKCGSRLKKIKSTKSRTLKKTGLKKGLVYKYKVKAYKMKNGKKVYITSSYSAHAVAGGYSRKLTDVKKITAAKKRLTLKAGKSARVRASQTKLKRGRKFLKTSHAALLRYRSTDKSVATVSRSGKVKAKKAGTCRIYIYAQNGLWTSTKVTVK